MTTPTTTRPVPPDDRLDGPIHEWFGLSYANYAVIPRARLQSMPVEWQERMVACLAELDEAFNHLDADGGLAEYDVRTGFWIPAGDLSASDRKATGVSVSTENPDVYHDIDGNELSPHNRVFVPGPDPNPHYNRGRTYLPPFGEDPS